jgi:chromosome segregation ATPase
MFGKLKATIKSLETAQATLKQEYETLHKRHNTLFQDLTNMRMAEVRREESLQKCAQELERTKKQLADTKYNISHISEIVSVACVACEIRISKARLDRLIETILSKLED